MKYSYKLDALREMARERAGDAYALYLIGLLVEHADKEEVTPELLGWVKMLFEV